MYIRGLIPRNWPRHFTMEVDKIASQLSLFSPYQSWVGIEGTTAKSHQRKLFRGDNATCGTSRASANVLDFVNECRYPRMF